MLLPPEPAEHLGGGVGEDPEGVGEDDSSVDSLEGSVAELARVGVKLELALDAEVADAADGVAEADVADDDGAGVGGGGWHVGRHVNGPREQTRFGGMEAGQHEPARRVGQPASELNAEADMRQDAVGR